MANARHVAGTISLVSAAFLFYYISLQLEWNVTAKIKLARTKTPANLVPAELQFTLPTQGRAAKRYVPCSKAQTIVIVVLSRAESIDLRMAIRSTWGRQWHSLNRSWETFFVVGQSTSMAINANVSTEQATYEDVLVGNFGDAIEFNPDKMILSFSWVNLVCDYKYLIRADDDVFMHILNIFRYLDNRFTPTLGLYAGALWLRSYPHRQGKYKVTKEQWPDKPYPPYIDGPAILLSRDVVQSMLAVHEQVPKFIHDDVWVGLLAERVGLRPVHVPSFVTTIRGQSPYPCSCDEKRLVQHKIYDTECLKKLYECFSKI